MIDKKGFYKSKKGISNEIYIIILLFALRDKVSWKNVIIVRNCLPCVSPSPRYMQRKLVGQ